MAVLALLTGCTSGSGDAVANGKGPMPVPVRVAAVVAKDVPVQLRAIGTVEPFSTVSVKSQVEGSLAEVHFEEGDSVPKDQLLFVIDPRPFEAAVRQAEANLAKDEAQARNATTDLERRTQLFEQGLVSRDEFDNSRTNAAVLESLAKADQAALDNAKLKLQYCYIHSPVDGRVGQLLVHEGNLVKQNDTTLAVINQIKPTYVAFSVPEQWLPDIRERNTASPLEVETRVGHEHPTEVRGHLSFINNTVDRNTGTVLLKALFANEEEVLWPGQFVDVAITLETVHDARLVPFSAIQTGQQGQFVWIINNEHAAEVRPVVTGDLIGTDIVVREGLQPGETVVVDGELRLAPGSKVEIDDGAKG